MRPSPPTCVSQNSALPSLIAAALLMIVPPVRGGTPTEESGARSPSATAMRTSIVTSPTVRNARIGMRMRKECLIHHNGLSPVSMERDLRAPRRTFAASPSTVGEAGRGSKARDVLGTSATTARDECTSHAITVKTHPCDGRAAKDFAFVNSSDRMGRRVPRAVTRADVGDVACLSSSLEHLHARVPAVLALVLKDGLPPVPNLEANPAHR